MKTFRTRLKSVSPYSQSKPVQTLKERDDTHAEHEEKFWRERMHVDSEGVVYIPPSVFKNCLSDAAKYKSIKIPGKPRDTYTKHFEAGIMVVEPLSLGIKKEEAQKETLFVSSNGSRGGKTRVWKNFPLFPSWEGIVEWLIFDETVNEKIFKTHLVDAGQFIGIGRFRPRNNGYYGRFEVVDMTVVESDDS